MPNEVRAMMSKRPWFDRIRDEARLACSSYEATHAQMDQTCQHCHQTYSAHVWAAAWNEGFKEGQADMLRQSQKL